MLNLLTRKLNKLSVVILNSKITYLFLVVIILIQFILVSIIFFGSAQLKDIRSQLNTIGAQQEQFNARINSLQSNILQMQAQFYRLQGTNK